MCRGENIEEGIPTTVIPLYRLRMVMLKVGDRFLRSGMGCKPTVRLKPPLYWRDRAEDEMERLLDPRATRRPRPENFDYEDFTFYADESATIAESWYQNARAFFHVRLGAQRQGQKGSTEYICAYKGLGKELGVRFDMSTYGSWWRLKALAKDQYVAESVTFPGYCLTTDSFGLRLCPLLTERDRARMVKGIWDKASTLTILRLPDFAVRLPGITVN